MMFHVPKHTIAKGGCNHDKRQAAKTAVLACGYGGGVNALLAFGADKMGMSNEDMVETVDLWRAANPGAVKLWKALEKAAIRCVVHGTPQVSTTGNIRFDMEKGILWMTLPSGRRIAYFGARYGESRWKQGRALSYMGVDQKTRKWTRIETWGGKITENLVQATARDCLRDAMLALDSAGYSIRAHIHDEVILSEPLDGRSVEDVSAIMGRDLAWAPGLPLRGDGYECGFYMKD
jgi:DNA polymerase